MYRKHGKRYVKPLINKFIEDREKFKANQKNEKPFYWDWLNNYEE